VNGWRYTAKPALKNTRVGHRDVRERNTSVLTPFFTTRSGLETNTNLQSRQKYFVAVSGCFRQRWHAEVGMPLRAPPSEQLANSPDQTGIANNTQPPDSNRSVSSKFPRLIDRELERSDASRRNGRALVEAQILIALRGKDQIAAVGERTIKGEIFSGNEFGQNVAGSNLGVNCMNGEYGWPVAAPRSSAPWRCQEPGQRGSGGAQPRTIDRIGSRRACSCRRAREQQRPRSRIRLDITTDKACDGSGKHRKD